MIRFLLSRVVQSLVALAILSVVVFILARATGDPLQMILPMSATQEDYDNARRYLARIEELAGAPVAVAGVGPGREENVHRHPLVP